MLGSLILYPKGRRIMMFQLSVYDYKSKTLNIKPSHPQSYTVQVTPGTQIVRQGDAKAEVRGPQELVNST